MSSSSTHLLCAYPPDCTVPKTGLSSLGQEWCPEGSLVHPLYPLGNYFHLSPLNTDGPGSIPVFPVSRQYVIHCVTSHHRHPELACFCASTAARGPSPCWGSANSSLRFFVSTISSVWNTQVGSTSIHTADSNFTQVHIKTSSKFFLTP